MITIYYKDKKLNKTKTALSLGKYYLGELLHGRKPIKVIVDSSQIVINSF